MYGIADLICSSRLQRGYTVSLKFRNLKHTGNELLKVDLKISTFEFVKIESQRFQCSNNNSNILVDQKNKNT